MHGGWPQYAADGGESLRYEIAGEADLVAARDGARRLAGQLGFALGETTLIATAITELGRNILMYAGAGEITMSVSRGGLRQGLEITARDRGPGIGNLRQALQDGYSTSSGLGLGLPGVRRLVDEFTITSEAGSGTQVRIKKWLPVRQQRAS